MGLIFVKIGCLGAGILLLWIAYLFSPWHEEFPFGNYMCLALACAGILSFWGAFRIHKRFERRAIVAGAVTGLILACVSRFAGILFEVIFGTGNLSPMAGIFVLGPTGFIVGSIGGIAAIFLRHR